MTTGAIPGEALVAFAPKALAGTARSHLLDQAFAIAAAYDLGNGKYLNLDIKNTFHRTIGSDLEEARAKGCPQTQKIGGFTACMRVSQEGAWLHWYLPDRVTIDLAAPDEATLRKAASDLPLAEIAKLSAAK